MGSLNGRVRRLEDQERSLGDPKPVRIDVVQEGPPGREGEVEPLYTFVLQPPEEGESDGA